jgi:hypothetical protein
MISLDLAKTLRENLDEIVQRWLSAVHGHVAEDYEQILHTSMEQSVLSTLTGLAVELLGAEEYQRPEIIHRARDVARDSAFRRAAVGFCLPDLITNAIAMRTALVETVFNHVTPSISEGSTQLRDSILALNQFGDAVISGEIAGFFAYYNYGDSDDVGGHVA